MGHLEKSEDILAVVTGRDAAGNPVGKCHRCCKHPRIHRQPTCATPDKELSDPKCSRC